MLSLLKQLWLKNLLIRLFGLLLSTWASTGLAVSNITVLLSLPDQLHSEVRNQIETEFDAKQYLTKIYPLSQIQNSQTIPTELTDILIAAGRASCEYASEYLLQFHVLCVLVSNDAFSQIKLQRTAPDSNQRFAAIVLDQPIERQVKVASKVYPSLKKFGLLASGKEYSLAEIQRIPNSVLAKVRIDKFNQNRAVAPQVVSALSGQDALVATPDKNVYSTDQLRTVLLTAYGYAKPVIGYSRAYVKAGALITTFSTPGQVFKQAAEMLESFISNAEPPSGDVYNPNYFSITDNPSIAKSLGLVRRFRFFEGYDYIDQDFST